VLNECADDLVTRNAAIDRLEGLPEERPEAVRRIARMLSVCVRESSREYPAKDSARNPRAAFVAGRPGRSADGRR